MIVFRLYSKSDPWIWLVPDLRNTDVLEPEPRPASDRPPEVVMRYSPTASIGTGKDDVAGVKSKCGGSDRMPSTFKLFVWGARPSTVPFCCWLPISSRGLTPGAR